MQTLTQEQIKQIVQDQAQESVLKTGSADYSQIHRDLYAQLSLSQEYEDFKKDNPEQSFLAHKFKAK
jgi:hypothetical protein